MTAVSAGVVIDLLDVTRLDHSNGLFAERLLLTEANARQLWMDLSEMFVGPRD